MVMVWFVLAMRINFNDKDYKMKRFCKIHKIFGAIALSMLLLTSAYSAEWHISL